MRRIVLLAVLCGAISLTGCESGSADLLKEPVDQDGDGFADQDDCGDLGVRDSSIYPGALEVCDGRDNDCDGETDEGVGTTVFDDTDGDGHGNPATEQNVCEVVEGQVEVGDDCDDIDPSVNPEAEEFCDGLDNDCDPANDILGDTFYSDGDLDGHGDPAGATMVSCTDPGLGWSTLADDCNDADALRFPGNPEVCDGLDNDCDLQILVEEVDSDGDGAVACDPLPDCNPANGAVYPGAIEICDGLDNDCDLLVPADEIDGDGDGSSECVGDCNDLDASVNPAAAEVCGNGIDDDCDPANDVLGDTFYSDGDEDGHGDPLGATTVSCTDPGVGWSTLSDDCNDADALRFPGNPEVCDGLDNDRDLLVPTNEADGDSDGFNGCAGDCDDLDSSVNPSATEVCNGIDDNCDSALGAGEVDIDLDGFMVCEGDCDDAALGVNPDAPEICGDGLDNDCDPANDILGDTFYSDGDLDGHGDPAGATTVSCTGPGVGWSTLSDDCNDADALRFPGNPEVCDGLDNDCDLQVPADEIDGDGDGSSECAGDCNDLDAGVNPLEAEVCDGVDNNCDNAIDDGAAAPTAWYADIDGDGFGDDLTVVAACTQPTDHVGIGGDCNDLVGAIYPGAPEVCNGDDDDCDANLGLDEVDNDLDGFMVCEGDCDDAVPEVNPSVAEICGDGVDNDCDPFNDLSGVTYYEDVDLDSYGDPAGNTTMSCVDPGVGWATVADDCDDGNAAVNPGETEVCNGVDDNCDLAIDDGLSFLDWYADLDLDGWGDPANALNDCAQPIGYIADKSGCDDGNSGVYPGATEVCNDLDEDCDAIPDNGLATLIYYLDSDLDGWGDPANALDDCAQPPGYVMDNTDCDDSESTAFPGGHEILIVDTDADGVLDTIDDQCVDAIDNDCDGEVDDAVDCGDGDGDGVENAIDMILMLDGNGDGNNDTQCVVSDPVLTMPAPHDSFGAIVQGDGWGGFNTLAGTVLPLVGIDRDGNGVDEVSGWCHDFIAATPPGTGNWNWRFVSEIAEDGASIAPAVCVNGAPATTWVPLDLGVYCPLTVDPACSYGFFNDGCGALIADYIRTNWDPVTETVDYAP